MLELVGNASSMLIATGLRPMDLAYQFVLPSVVLSGSYQVCLDLVWCWFDLSRNIDYTLILCLDNFILISSGPQLKLSSATLSAFSGVFVVLPIPPVLQPVLFLAVMKPALGQLVYRGRNNTVGWTLLGYDSFCVWLKR